MQVLHFDYRKVPGFSPKDLAYLCDDPRLSSFCLWPQKLEVIDQVIAQRRMRADNRALLVEVLRDQYRALAPCQATQAAIELLAHPDTFTVTTAHQPSLFTGPLYFIYKIVSTIHLAQLLRHHFPDKHFVPVFVIGGEDHDFQEINHAWVFGHRIEWQAPSGGPVGRMPTNSLQPALQMLKQVLANRGEAMYWYEFIYQAYTQHPTYGQATQALVDSLFGEWGLITIQMDDRRLKAAFRPWIKREVLEQVSHPIVTATQAELQTLGFSPQAYVRRINFFYMTDTTRERIEPEGDGFRLITSNRWLSKAEMEATIDAHPECFSPNVVMRPVYQEFVLPNLAYIGGGGEIAYWLERKAQFDALGIPYPMLVRRNSALWIDRGDARRMYKLSLQVADLLDDVESVIKKWLTRHAQGSCSLSEEKQALQALFQRLAQKAKAIDPTMEKKVLAEGARQLKALEGIEKRLIRAEKQKHDQAINQLRKLHAKLFPNGGLQERRENFLSIVSYSGKAFFDALLAHLNPMDRRFKVFVDAPELGR